MSENLDVYVYNLRKVWFKIRNRLKTRIITIIIVKADINYKCPSVLGNVFSKRVHSMVCELTNWPHESGVDIFSLHLHQECPRSSRIIQDCINSILVSVV